MTSVFPSLEREVDYSACKGALVLLTGYASPDRIRRAGQNRLTGWLRARKVRNAAGVAVRALTAAEAQSITLPGQDITASIISELATSLVALDERVKTLDAQIRELFAQHPQAAVIESMPGFGPFLGASLLVSAGDLRPFPSAGHLAAAAGLVPVPNDSGRRTGNPHRPLRYSRPLRHVFYLSAQISMMRAGPNRDYYLKKRSRGRHPQPGRHRPGPPAHRRALGAAAREPALDPSTTTTRPGGMTRSLRFPVAEPATALDRGGTFVDQLGRRDEPRAAAVVAAAVSSQWPSGAEFGGQCPAQTALSAVVERLVDRFVADVPLRLIGVGDAQVPGDLLGAPLQLQQFFDEATELLVTADPGPAGAKCPLPCPGVGEVAVVVAVVAGGVAAQFAADRRRRSTEAAGVVADAAPGPSQRGDALAVQQRQEPRRTPALGQPFWCQPAGLGAPLVAGLAPDVERARRLDRDDPVRQRSPELNLQVELPLTSSPSRTQAAQISRSVDRASGWFCAGRHRQRCTGRHQPRKPRYEPGLVGREDSSSTAQSRPASGSPLRSPVSSAGETRHVPRVSVSPPSPLRSLASSAGVPSPTRKDEAMT